MARTKTTRLKPQAVEPDSTVMDGEQMSDGDYDLMYSQLISGDTSTTSNRNNRFLDDSSGRSLHTQYAMYAEAHKIKIRENPFKVSRRIPSTLP